jgi:hypothetical protein
LVLRNVYIILNPVYCLVFNSCVLYNSVSPLRVIDILDYSGVSFDSTATIGHLCEELNAILGQSIRYDTFRIQNTKWLWLLNDVAAMNSEKVKFGAFGLYPSLVSDTLNEVQEFLYSL